MIVVWCLLVREWFEFESIKVCWEYSISESVANIILW